MGNLATTYRRDFGEERPLRRSSQWAAGSSLLGLGTTTSVNSMNPIESLTYPILAFTPNGVMPYSKYDNLRRVMKHEYDMNWFKDLEVVDSAGACAVIRSARIVKQPMLASIFGGMIEVELEDAERLCEYDLVTTKDRVQEFLRLYPDGYQSQGILDELETKIEKASSVRQVVEAFMK